MDYTIRPLTAMDEQLLWEMLYQGIYSGSAGTVPAPDIVRKPEFAQYVSDWGRPGDSGFVAHDSQTKPIGAAWFRFPPSQKEKDGNAVPELAFAVRSEHRRQGIGAALLTYMVKAHPDYSTISIPVSPGNPTVRLYERFGFKATEQGQHSVLMHRDLA
jgi:GNAT superfamily N-acetyltransferase